VALVLLELAAVVLALALLARLAARTGFSPIPLYLIAGLVLAAVFSPTLSVTAVRLESQIAVALLLFMLGLEYTGEELRDSLRSGRAPSAVDFVLNFTPGLVAGFLLGWSWLACVVLGGITYISSSSIVAKVLDDLDRLGNRETPAVLSLLVTEDLVMAVFLPLVAVALAGAGVLSGLLSVVLALATVGVALYVAMRHGGRVSRVITHSSDEVVLLSVLGLLLVVAALGELLQFSAAVGAFLVGIALSGPLVEHARRIVGPLRDIAAAAFFVLFGLQVEIERLPDVLLPALVLAAITMLTKLATGWVAARGCAAPGKLRAGTALMARGEFSVIVAELAVVAGLQSRLGPLAVTYVLATAVIGPLATRSAGSYRRPKRPRPSPPARGERGWMMRPR
jgi:CPA2 family monovalent cation:H+ antiporter-2